jgi:Protein of unknown function (DUF2569)
MAKDCPRCGTICPDETRICDCGYDFAAGAAGQGTDDDYGKYRGVGGWLLLLCVGLTILGPLFAVASLTGSFREVSPLLDQFPGLMVLMVVDTTLTVGLMAFSIYAGVALWQIRPGAVSTAKRYLLWSLVYLPVTAVLPFMVGLLSESHPAMLKEIARDTLRGVIATAIWYWYLTKSKRVKATYRVWPSQPRP